jgi:hypothetical protein
MKTKIHLCSYLAHFFLEQEMFQINVAQKFKTHILCSILFFENRVAYEITWKNIVQPGRRVRFVWWITKATDTNS